MASTFRQAAAALGDAEQQILFGSIPRLIGAVAMADGFTSDEEITRGIDGLIAVVGELGDEFRYSPHAEAAFDALADSLETRDAEFPAYLARLRDVVLQLPPELARRYRAFVARLCIDVARASREYVGWGKRIDDAEARLLADIVAALELEIHDLAVRERIGLGLEPP
ncbi:MAG: hypothetical protein IT373_32285 [Polyangiaceae bacterium]|nr:hypothetical protein [Polyangiaceae bacterium]